METKARLDSIKENFLGQKNIWDINYKEPRFDRDLTMEFTSKHRGSVRFAMGLFHTDEEWERIRKESLSTPLP